MEGVALPPPFRRSPGLSRPQAAANTFGRGTGLASLMGMAATDTTLSALKKANDEALERLTKWGVQISGIDTQYVVMLCEAFLAHADPKRLGEVQLAHAEWCRDRLADAEAQVRRAVLTSSSKTAK